ncbi:hypothetical protein [Micromonospora sp. NPDC005173]|uniref:hypothetical protein n=1 Tax=Micromonospora sp. NPDC005173 TaxID=3157165 RepID=UPI0033B13740
MTDMPPEDMVDGLAELLNPYMRRILGGSEDPHDVVDELKWTLTEAPHMEHSWGAGWLYRMWGSLSDIIDGYPVDFGPDREAIAIREFRHAAQDWLGMPRTRAGLESYIERQRTRLASLWSPGPRTE